MMSGADGTLGCSGDVEWPPSVFQVVVLTVLMDASHRLA